MNNQKIKMLFSILISMWSLNSYAVPTFYWCCDPCTDDKVDCHSITSSWSNCSDRCPDWRPNSIYRGSDGSTCLDAVACAGVGASPTPTPSPTPAPSATVAGPFIPVGPIGVFSPTPSPTMPPIVNMVIVAPTSDPYDFGSVEKNQSSAPLTIKVRSQATGDLYGCAPSFGTMNEFTMLPGTCTTLTVGATCDVAIIQAKPSAVANFTSGAFTFSCTNGGSVSISSFKVTGTPPTACSNEGEVKDATTGSCACPVNYELVSTGASTYGCRPKLISTFYRGTSSDDYYPVCGRNRIAVNANSSVLDISSNSVPNTSFSVNFGTKDGTTAVNFKYAKAGAGGTPEYLYGSGSRCSCAYQPYTSPAVKGFNTAGNPNSTLGNPPRAIIAGETYAVISGQTSSNKMDYGPVAVAKDLTGSTDGRIGTNYGNNLSECECPNFNEEMVPIDIAHTNVPQGAFCRSIIPDTDPNRVLVNFDPNIHDKSGSSQIYNRASVVQVGGVVVPKVALPIAIGKTGTMPYQRKIWTCQPHTVFNPVSRSCEFLPERNACGGKTASAEASAVSSAISGRTADEKFLNAGNPKLSCCLAVSTKGVNNYKMDCIDNHSANLSFNDLWASSDSAADGGKLNAVVLRNQAGQYLTGFYGLDGHRWAEGSEFGGTLQPAIVSAKKMISVTGQAQAVPEMSYKGSPLPLPSGDGSVAYAALHGLGRVPTSADERRAYPILVRAAMKVECDSSNPASPALPTMYAQYASVTGTTNTATKIRCVSAKKVVLHVNVMQITEIEGMKTLKTYDTVSDPNKASTISVKSIIDRLNGGDCPADSVREGQRCVAK